MLGYGERVLRVAFETEMQGFNALEKQEGIEGRERCAGVTQTLDASFENESQWSEGFVVAEAVVGGIRLGEFLETAIGPVEFACVHDDSTDGGAVAAEELGGGVYDNVCAPLDGTD